MFVSKYIGFLEASRIVRDRQHLQDDAQNPVLIALQEGAIIAEIASADGWAEVSVDWWRNPPIAWPRQYQAVIKRDDQVYLSEIRIARSAFENLWPQEPSKRSVNLGGRQPKWNWEAAMIELARIAVHDDDPSREAMTKKITDWFAEQNNGEAPVPSQIREKVRIFHEAFGRQEPSFWRFLAVLGRQRA